jgi:GT2 family glycosyltransferase
MGNVAILQATHLLLEDKKGISVIIPNYNGSELFPQILPPLIDALKATTLPYEIIVSDDKSQDDSVNYLRSNFPEIPVLEADKNRGFSPTINKGIFVAQYSIVFLLNSDVKVTGNYF